MSEQHQEANGGCEYVGMGGEGESALPRTPRSPSTDGDLSQRRTRDGIVSPPISWFLIHPGPLQPEQVRSCSGIYFPAHLGLGTAPGFRNTW